MKNFSMGGNWGYADYCMIKKKLMLKNAYVIGAWNFYTDIQLFAVKTWGNSPLKY